MQLAGFTKRHSGSISRSISRKFSTMVRHKTGDWEAAAAAANAAVAAETAAHKKVVADLAAAATHHEKGDKVSEPERTQYYLRQGVTWLLEMIL